MLVTSGWAPASMCPTVERLYILGPFNSVSYHQKHSPSSVHPRVIIDLLRSLTYIYVVTYKVKTPFKWLHLQDLTA